MRLKRISTSVIFGTVGLFAVTALISAIAAWAVSYSSQSGLERPKSTDWMQAWGTIAGVFAGFAAAVAAAALIVHERQEARLARVAAEEEQKRRDEDQKRRRAEQVTWYLREKEEFEAILRTPVDAGQHTHGALPSGTLDAVLVIINNSDNCIYPAVASIPRFRKYEHNEYLARRGLGTIPPGRTEISMPMTVRREGSGATRNIDDLPNNRPVEYVQFKDPSNKAWRRFGQGELVEVAQDDPGLTYPDYSW